VAPAPWQLRWRAFQTRTCIPRKARCSTVVSGPRLWQQLGVRPAYSFPCTPPRSWLPHGQERVSTGATHKSSSQRAIHLPRSGSTLQAIAC